MSEVILSKVTVDYLLDNVDLTFEGYIPSAVAFEFFSFIRLCLGEEPENSNPLAHYFLIDTIFKQPNVEFYYTKRGIDYSSLVGKTAILCSREFSKALALDTKIITPNGYTTMGDIQVGDTVYDRNGKPTLVRSKSKLFLKHTYRMVLEDGRELYMSEDHDNIIWKRKNKRLHGINQKHHIQGLEEVVMTARDIHEDGVFWRRTVTDKMRKDTEHKFYIPRMQNPVDMPETDFPLDAYTVGLILGDGSISKETGFTRITSHVNDFDDIVKHIPYKIGTINETRENIKFFSILGIGSKVKEYIGVWNVYDKRVPDKLKVGSIQQRLSVLQGLMDTDGTVNMKGSTSFSSVSIQLAKDVQELVWSLGGSATIKEYKSKSPFGKYWMVNIRLNMNLFRLPRKAERQKYVAARDKVAIIDMELVHTRPTKCITVESDTKSFLTENYIVTHNSTLIGTYLPLFMAWRGNIPGYGKVNYGLYIGDSMRNNVKTTMNTIEKVFLESEWLLDQFESYRFTDEVMELVRHPRTNKELAEYKRAMDSGKKKEQVPGRSKRTFSMKGVGAQTGTRGTRNALQRPQFAIFDDLVPSEADSNSEAVLSSIETTIDSDVLKALHGGGSFAMIIGTPYNKKDPVYRRLESGSWVPVVFPICERIYPGMKEEDFKGVWEDRHSYKNVMHRYNSDLRENKLRSFHQELMLRISSEEDRLIPDSYLNWFKRSDVIQRGTEYTWYVTTDFTTSGKKGNDFSGIAVWAVNSNEDWMLVDLSLKKLELNEQYMELFRLVGRYKKFTGNIEVGVEIDGQQKTHIYAIKQIMAKRNEYFTIAKQKGKPGEGISSGGVKKFERFKGHAVPYFQNGKIWFAEELKSGPDMQELLNELQYTTYEGFGSGHDDGCDLITMMGMMNVYPPSEVDIKENIKDRNDIIWDDYEKEEKYNNTLSSYIV